MKFGPNEGNSGAMIRWGKYLDNGVWITVWKFRSLWLRRRFMKGYANFGIIVFRWNN